MEVRKPLKVALRQFKKVTERLIALQKPWTANKKKRYRGEISRQMIMVRWQERNSPPEGLSTEHQLRYLEVHKAMLERVRLQGKSANPEDDLLPLKPTRRGFKRKLNATGYSGYWEGVEYKVVVDPRPVPVVGSLRQSEPVHCDQDYWQFQIENLEG